MYRFCSAIIITEKYVYSNLQSFLSPYIVFKLAPKPPNLSLLYHLYENNILNYFIPLRPIISST